MEIGSQQHGAVVKQTVGYYVTVIFLLPGGCDGCLNIENPDNKGLEGLVANLEAVYQENSYEDIISSYLIINTA